MTNAECKALLATCMELCQSLNGDPYESIYMCWKRGLLKESEFVALSDYLMDNYY